MVKQKRSPIEKITTLRSKDVAKLWFTFYLTKSAITKIMYKEAWDRCVKKNKQGFVMTQIEDYFKDWETEGFIEKSKEKIPFWSERNGKKESRKHYGWRINFEPLYRFCKEDYDITFTKEEKEVIEIGLGNTAIRKQIILQYPKDDLIQAILKFYVKTYAIPNIDVLNKNHMKFFKIAENMCDKETKLIEELKKKQKRKKQKVSVKNPYVSELEFNNRILHDIFKMASDRKMSLDEAKLFSKLTHLQLYITSYKKNPELISSINKKFKKALGILPN